MRVILACESMSNDDVDDRAGYSSHVIISSRYS